MSAIIHFPRSMVSIEVADENHANFGWVPRFIVSYRDMAGAESIFWDGLSFSEATMAAENLRADFAVKSPIADSTAWCRQ